MFMNAGQLKLNEALTVSVDKPVTMLLKENVNGELDAWISDPNQNQTMIELTIIKEIVNAMPEIVQRIVVLPSGNLTGKGAFTTTGNVTGFGTL